MSSPTFDIQPATEPEREWAALLIINSEPWTKVGPPNLERARKSLHDPEYLMYIAHFEGKPSGMILLHKRGFASSPYVRLLSVAPEFRGRGVGAGLMQFAEDLLKPEFKHLFLCVSSFNPRAKKFYERIGYKVVGEVKDYVLNGESEFMMHKRIA
jgi:ribosomal-protein-alanine N-acetyltransferase